MTTAQPLTFPSPDAIPPDAALAAPVHQRDYLLGGEMRRWEGPVQDVLSPICEETPSGPAQRTIGSFPLFSEADALAALDAAAAAWDNGRGAWLGGGREHAFPSQ